LYFSVIYFINRNSYHGTHHQQEKDVAMPASTSASSITLYGVPLSGHCHRVALLLSMLDLPYTSVDAPASLRQSDRFLKLNPLGQIPVLVDGDLVLADSNAILVYLVKRYAPGSHWLPEDAILAAHVQRWLSIAAGEVRYGPASARMTTLWNMPGEVDPALAAHIAHRLFRMMDAHLAERSFLVGPDASIADLACYSYIAHAPEGRISLDAYPAIRAWLARVEALPRFAPMPHSPIPEAS
jgi:glutathione S-transferase